MDTTLLSNFVYLFRTVPGVTKYIEALALVVKHYSWTKVSIMHTSDIPGIIGKIEGSLVKHIDCSNGRVLLTLGFISFHFLLMRFA